ncbi:N-formylglutamate amidohydrolase [Swingsia samuiensis]|uniref:N-formylglutamate amidohydrolase n=1 Tax=Swingsia samuiensis TaxID=1293412 RepID=UPI0015E8B967|nr:N-formylglutamate amidohydrolase [Swingsia samuiensis]
MPLIISSPHSGRIYFSDFVENSRVSFGDLQRVEDRYIDLFFDEESSYGATFLSTDFPRSWCDVNRDYRELDPNMFRPALDYEDILISEKVKNGFGVIPRCISQGKSIYTHCLPQDEINFRLSIGWFPYHERLNNLIRQLYNTFGKVFIIDFHSMPPLLFNKKTDFVLGNNHGKSCSSDFVSFIENFLLKNKYQVKINTPYSGGYITKKYGNPDNNIHVIQIEIDRSLYINLSTLKLSSNFIFLKKQINNLIKEIVDFI